MGQDASSTALERVRERVRLAADNDSQGFTKLLLDEMQSVTVKEINRGMGVGIEGQSSTIYESFLREYVYFKLAIRRVRKRGLRRLYEDEYAQIPYYERRASAARSAAMESLNEL
jgi:hypothetical protein